jgi:thiol-disulfide isomerase/thioredoxin
VSPFVKRRLIFTGVGCVLAAVLAVGLFGNLGNSNSSLNAGATLPTSLPALNGHGRVALPKLGSSQSQPVVITFFASWCGPCAQEIPAVAKFAELQKAKGTNIAFIGIDENDPRTSGKAFVKRSGVGFAVGSDADGIVLQDLGAEAALPQTIFINTQGQIIEHVYGSVTSGSALETWVGKLTG